MAHRTHRSIISRETFFTVLVRTRPERDRDRETEREDGVSEECRKRFTSKRCWTVSGRSSPHVHPTHVSRSSLHSRCVCSHRNKHCTADEKEANGGTHNTSRRATGCCLLCASHLPIHPRLHSRLAQVHTPTKPTRCECARTHKPHHGVPTGSTGAGASRATTWSNHSLQTRGLRAWGPQRAWPWQSRPPTHGCSSHAEREKVTD